MGHHVAKKYVETILAKVVVGKMTFCLGDHNNDLKDIFLVGPKVAGDWEKIYNIDDFSSVGESRFQKYYKIILQSTLLKPWKNKKSLKFVVMLPKW